MQLCSACGLRVTFLGGGGKADDKLQNKILLDVGSHVENAKSKTRVEIGLQGQI